MTSRIPPHLADQLFLTPEYKNISDWETSVDLAKGDTEITLPDNLGRLVFSHQNAKQKASTYICLPKKEQQVSVRFSHDNPKCLPEFRQRTRSLKKILQELDISPWQRKRIAFLYYDNELVAAIGHFICQPFIVNDTELGMYVSQCT